MILIEDDKCIYSDYVICTVNDCSDCIHKPQFQSIGPIYQQLNLFEVIDNAIKNIKK